MAEGFEPYHVPQQSRRDKLRLNHLQPCHVVDHGNLLACSQFPLANLYDSSLDLINPSFHLGVVGAGKEDASMSSLGFMGGMNMIDSASNSSSTNHMATFVDPQFSVQSNPNRTVQDIDGSSPCVFPVPLHNYKGDFEQSFQGNGVVLFEPDHHLKLPAKAHDPNGSCAAASGQSLSLSLSSLDSHYNNPPPQRYNASTGNNSKMDGGYVCAGRCGNFSRNALPLGPFIGYASVLKGSRFLRPAQQLLEEICDVGRLIFGDGMEAAASDDDSLNCSDGFDDGSLNCSEQTGNKSMLLSMLSEVHKRYKQYCQQMHSVFMSFESVSGLSSAAPFANRALKGLSRHFKCLKDAISDQLQFANKSNGKVVVYEGDETKRLVEYTKFVNQPVWRPQRGLPERSVTFLRAWLFEHFLHPYPTDADKLMLAKQTGLSRNQVSNWFINARVRLWKPMVEEIHTLETHQSHKTGQRAEQTDLATSSIECENGTSSALGTRDLSLKRARDKLKNGRRESTGLNDVRLNKLSHPQSGGGLSNIGAGCSGVSLTLGLHGNGVGFSESYPINAARRFGLDTHEFSGLAAHNGQLGRDVNEGHDFQEPHH